MTAPLVLSIVIPAKNEEENLPGTIRGLIDTLRGADIAFEIICVNDHSDDRTEAVLAMLATEHREVRWVENCHAPGFGYAVHRGLEEYQGDAVCLVMADGSDDPVDVVTYYRALQQGVECVFGSRFLRQSVVRDYPIHKLVINRLANGFIQVLFGLRYNDVTNAFKCYRRHVIDGVQPVLSRHFNLTVELPLKAIVRGYSYRVVPINWYGRLKGISKLKIREMGSRYLFIVLYILLERILSRGDYRREQSVPPGASGVDLQPHAAPASGAEPVRRWW